MSGSKATKYDQQFNISSFSKKVRLHFPSCSNHVSNISPSCSHHLSITTCPSCFSSFSIMFPTIVSSFFCHVPSCSHHLSIISHSSPPFSIIFLYVPSCSHPFSIISNHFPITFHQHRHQEQHLRHTINERTHIKSNTHAVMDWGGCPPCPPHPRPPSGLGGGPG